MGDTMFNIFGDGILESTNKKVMGVKTGENAFAGKGVFASKTNTPAKFNKNLMTPKNLGDPKRKTFLDNEGVSIQMSGIKKSVTNSTSKPKILPINKLQLYEDVPQKKTFKEPNYDLDFNRKPMFCDDLSDDEFQFSEEELNKITFGLPQVDRPPLPKMDKPEMIPPKELGYSIHDIFKDAQSDDDSFSINDDLPVPMF